jgi:hypothetical protein
MGHNTSYPLKGVSVKHRSTVLSKLSLVLLLFITIGLPSGPASGQSSPSLTMMNHRVTDAEYSKQLDRIITVSSIPANRLHIIDPYTGSDAPVDLPLAPTSVSVGPDGAYATVGHNGWLSYVDLKNHELIRTFPISTDVLDVVLAGNGYVYAFPRVDQWEYIRCLNLRTGTETLGTGQFIYAGTRAKLHPGGTAIYGADNGLSPADIEKYDITNGTAAYLYDSPYHGDYSMCGDLWISEDGFRIFTKCGNVFRSSENKEEDMRYNGSLSDIKRITHLNHSAAAGKVAAIPSNTDFPKMVRDTEVWLYGYDYLGFETVLTLPNFSVNEALYKGHGRFVFFNAAGTKLFTIVQADETSGLLLDYAIAANSPGQGGWTVYTISASAGPGGTITPSGGIEISDGESMSFTISPDEGCEIADVLVDGVSVGAVALYEFKDVGSNHSIVVYFKVTGNISDFFPLTSGISWTYAVNGDQQSTQAMTVMNKVVVEGIETTAMKQFGSNVQSYYTSDEGGIRIHGIYYPKAYVAGRYRKMTVTFIPPIRLARGTAVFGQTSDSIGIARAVVPGFPAQDFTYDASYTVEGVESLTVPAGTYRALRISGNLTISGQTETDMVYLARNVGEVKEVYDNGSGQSTTLELLHTNAGVHDLALTGTTAPKTITMNKKVSRKTETVKVTFQNRSPHPEVIADPDTLAKLVSLEVHSLGPCKSPVPALSSVNGKSSYPISIASKASLTVNYNVPFDCVNDPLRTTPRGGNHNDYRYTALVNHAALDGEADTHTSDDACPRSVAPPYEIDPNPDGTIKDKGCGALKKDRTYGDDIVTDIVVAK